ncbi:MAG: ATP-binding cassette domain-containing protein [Acidimicrobiales bacterium]
MIDRQVSTLSGGERAKVWLAIVGLSQFDVMLLDEPTNDLDLDGIAHLERLVLAQRGPVIVVSHDRQFLDHVVTDVVEFDVDPRESAKTSAHRFGGGWSAFLEERRSVVNMRSSGSSSSRVSETDCSHGPTRPRVVG